jgi:hypothetical protein
MWGLGLPGLGLAGALRSSTAIPGFVFTLPISSGVWDAYEAPSDADTRHTYARLVIPRQPAYDFGPYRGPDPAGNLAQIGLMTWTGSYYEWLSTGQADFGSPVYNRLARRVASPVGAWEWITGAGDLKPFTASDVPEMPVWSWVSTGAGLITVTLDSIDWNRRTGTGGYYQIDGGTPVAFTSTTTINLTGLSVGVDFTLGIAMTNANGTGAYANKTVATDTAAPAPPAPLVSYIIDGTGTQAVVTLDPAEGYDSSGVIHSRYTIDGGTPVVIDGFGPISLTGLAASQELVVDWEDAGGYSATATITLIASPTTYTSGDWTLVDAASALGDELTLTQTPPSTPSGLSYVRTEWTKDAGATWATLSGSSVRTGVSGSSATIALRVVYDIGPSVAGDNKSATPTLAPPVTDFPLYSTEVQTVQSSSVTSHPVTLPSHTAGDTLFVGMAFDGSPSVSATAGWTQVKASTQNDVTGNLYYFHKTAASSSETLTITTGASETSVAKAFRVRDTRSFLISTIDENSSTARPVDIANLSMGGGTEKAHFVTIIAQRREATAITSEPTTGSWSAMILGSSGTTSASVRLYSSFKDEEVTALNPPAWVGSVTEFTALMVAFLPTTGIVPTTYVTATPSASAITQGDPVTFTAIADGRPNITYDLVINGVTHSQTATTNDPVTFVVTPSSTSNPWTMTATNAAGSAMDSGTITAEPNLVWTIDSSSVYSITVQADSLDYDQVAASYELELQEADGTAIDTMAQAGADFDITFSGNGAYRFRTRAISSGAVPSTWGGWYYYAPWVQGEIQWPIKNAQAVQVSPICSNAPIEVVPVTGKPIVLFEVYPVVTREMPSTYNHLLNGIVVNPTNGGNLQGWDSRTGGRNALLNSKAGFFDVSLVNQTWPVTLPPNATVAKAKSRPTSLLDTGSQGHRGGTIDQHSGLVVMDVLSTSSPMQMAPSVIKKAGWTADPVDLPGWASMLSTLQGLTLSLSGMSYDTEIYNKMRRFNPTLGVRRGNTHDLNDNEAQTPWRSAPPSLINYRGFQADGMAMCLLCSDGLTNAQKAELLGAYIVRGHNSDIPGDPLRIGAGISQELAVPLSLARLARGVDFDDLADGTQSENAPILYGFWDSTTVTYLNPHDDPLKPLFSRRRLVTSVNADTATGHEFYVEYSGSKGESKQRFAGLNFYRPLTDEELPFDGPSGDTTTSTKLVRTLGFFSTPLTPGETIYWKIPDADMVNFVEGEPYWMYDTYDNGGSQTTRWQSFNPSAGMSYRDINEPHGLIIILHALGEYPDIPGSNWDATLQYTLKTRVANWPGPVVNYPFTASYMTQDFWIAHAETLGITL